MSESNRTTEQRAEDVIVKIDGKSFRCACGANVFHHPNGDDKSIYKCNACGEMYRGE